MKATAIAPVNIALIKYWGKRDEELILPQTNSISVCLSDLATTTCVEFRDDIDADSASFNDSPLEGKKLEKVVRQLDLVREMAGIESKAEVISTANFPMAAGLASSASGFAALSLAATQAAGISLSESELSILARRGSGSASRSIPDGFVEWQKGSAVDGSDSFASTILGVEEDWGFRIVIPIISTIEKKTSSRAGMAQTVSTCPYYPTWVETIEQDLETVRSGIQVKDFMQIAERAELNCLKMHATMITTVPPIIYWQPRTMQLIHLVHDLREAGLPVYFTIDGGPQVKIICQQQNVPTLLSELDEVDGIEETIVCAPAEGARLID